jgi:TPP-dependent pyruvate/acetoin dehydrogenase alpha subunit
MNKLTTQERLFRQSLRIRLVEERLVALYPFDKIQSPVHLSIGQEAVATGLCEYLERSDLLFPTYRSHAFYLAKGGDLKQMFAELYGKATGGCGGKAGSMHLAAPEVGYMGASAVVASSIPHAVGAALASKNLGKNQISLAVFGDGATEEGVFHESMNLAQKLSVPVLFVCENNGLAVHSCQAARQAYRLSSLAEAFGMPYTFVSEGYDDLIVADRMAPIIAEVRRAHRPQFVEIRTFRYKEHVGPGDDWTAGYRDSGELRKWQEFDPLMYRLDLVERFTPEIRAEIDEAVQFAEQSPWPGEADLLTHVL